MVSLPPDLLQVSPHARGWLFSRVGVETDRSPASSVADAGVACHGRAHGGCPRTPSVAPSLPARRRYPGAVVPVVTEVCVCACSSQTWISSCQDTSRICSCRSWLRWFRILAGCIPRHRISLLFVMPAPALAPWWQGRSAGRKKPTLCEARRPQKPGDLQSPDIIGMTPRSEQ